MSNFAPGDLVVCLGPPKGGVSGNARPGNTNPKKGRVYTVARVCPPILGRYGLVLCGPYLSDHPSGSWCATRFRKIDKADEGFATWMRSLRPIKTKAPADA